MRYDRHILGGCCNLEMQGTKSRSYILQLPKKSTLKFTLFCLCSKMKWAFHSPNFVVISQVAQTVSHFFPFPFMPILFSSNFRRGPPKREKTTSTTTTLTQTRTVFRTMQRILESTSTLPLSSCAKSLTHKNVNRDFLFLLPCFRWYLRRSSYISPLTTVAVL